MRSPDPGDRLRSAVYQCGCARALGEINCCCPLENNSARASIRSAVSARWRTAVLGLDCLKFLYRRLVQVMDNFSTIAF